MEWITDRQPSPEEADSDGMVCVRKNPSSEEDYWYLHWSYVGAGVPWRHSEYWWRPPSKPAPEPPAAAPEPQPAPEPVAADRPTLAVGQTWRRRDGQIVTIVKNDGTDAWPFLTSNGDWYAIDGFLLKHFYPNPRDLVELISEAPGLAPVSPAPEISPAPELPEVLRTIAIPRRCVSISWTINELDCLTFSAIDDDGAAWVLHPGATEWHRLTPPEPAPEPPAAEPEPQPAPVTPARRFVSISRTVNENGTHTLDAIDDDGVAWWIHESDPEWRQLPPLPEREAAAQQPQP